MIWILIVAYWVVLLIILKLCKAHKKLQGVLDDLPVATGGLKCQQCGSDKWSSATPDPNVHFLKAEIVNCSDCTPGSGLPKTEEDLT